MNESLIEEASCSLLSGLGYTPGRVSHLAPGESAEEWKCNCDELHESRALQGNNSTKSSFSPVPRPLKKTRCTTFSFLLVKVLNI